MLISMETVRERPGWKDWVVFMLVWSFLSVVMTGLPLVLLLLAESPDYQASFIPGFELSLPRSASQMLGALALGGQGFAAIAALYLVERVGALATAWLRGGFAWRGALRTGVLAILMMVAIQGGWHLLDTYAGHLFPQWASPSAEQKRLMTMLMGGASGTVPARALFLVVVGLLAPLAEELVFRGAIFGTMRLRYGFLAAAIASSLLFGLMHLSLAVPTALMGVVLAWVLERERSLYLPLALHAANNMIAGALLIF